MEIERTGQAPPEWEAVYGEDPRATLFLHPRWMGILAGAYPGYRPLYLVARAGSSVAGLLPVVRVRRFGFDQFLSLPAGAFGGPLVRGDAPSGTFAALGAAFRALASGSRVLRFEMSVHDPTPGIRTALEPSLGPSFQDLHTHVIDLDPDSPAPRRRRSAERSIRAAMLAGVRVGLDPSPEALGTLHRLHVLQSRAWAGIPAYPEAVVRTVAERFGPDARLYTARQGGRIVAACLCLEHGGREVHPWISGAAPESRDLGAFHALIDHALRDAAERGFRRWYFGGSGGNPRIEFFKESFGARPVPLLRCHRLAGWARPLRRRPSWDRPGGDTG